MLDPLATARRHHEEAENIKALADREEHPVTRTTLLAISELYFLLGDEFVNLSKPVPPGKVVKLRH